MADVCMSSMLHTALRPYIGAGRAAGLGNVVESPSDLASGLQQRL